MELIYMSIRPNHSGDRYNNFLPSSGCDCFPEDRPIIIDRHVKGAEMSKAVSMKTGQTSILIETDESVEVPTHLLGVVIASSPALPEGVGEAVDLGQVERKFSEIKNLIITCCNSVFDAMDSIADKPDKFAVEFGIKLAGDVGAPILTKSFDEANFKVSIEWKKD